MPRPSSLLVALLFSSVSLSATAPLDVSLTVRDSCLIEHDDARRAQPPAVSCALDAPYRIRAAGDRGTTLGGIPASIDAPQGARWEVMF